MPVSAARSLAISATQHVHAWRARKAHAQILRQVSSLPHITGFARLLLALVLCCLIGCSQPTRVESTAQSTQPDAARPAPAPARKVEAKSSLQRAVGKPEAKLSEQGAKTAAAEKAVPIKAKEKEIAETSPSKPVATDQTAKPPVGKSEQNSAVRITDVTISAASFNPTQGEEVGIYYNLSPASPDVSPKAAKVTIQVFDPDHGLMKTIVENEPQKIGKHQVIWSGKDLNGNVAPNEAYFFTIEAKDADGKLTVYDPTTISGGESHDITSSDINRAAGTLSYKMPETGRVLIRMGTRGGPLLSTLVDWQPRLKGEVTEYWNGKDQDGLINLRDRQDSKMIITYFTLPENSIITYGSKGRNFREYKRTVATDRPKKSARQRVKAPTVRLSPHYDLPRTIDYSPKLKMTFPTVKETDPQGRPILSGRVLVRVEFDEAGKLFFKNQKYEVTFFVDTVFYAEEEMGYSPYNWVWNVSEVKEGKHVLTVNMAGFKDQIGVLSNEVVVKK